MRRALQKSLDVPLERSHKAGRSKSRIHQNGISTAQSDLPFPFLGMVERDFDDLDTTLGEEEEEEEEQLQPPPAMSSCLCAQVTTPS